MSWPQRWLKKKKKRNFSVHIIFKLFRSCSVKTQALYGFFHNQLLQNCSTVLETSLLCIRKPENTQFVHRILECFRPGS
jgi:hypothetical protein